MHRFAGLWFAGFQPAVLGQVALVYRADVSFEVINAEEAHPAAGRMMSAGEFVEGKRDRQKGGDAMMGTGTRGLWDLLLEPTAYMQRVCTVRPE